MNVIHIHIRDRDTAVVGKHIMDIICPIEKVSQATYIILDKGRNPYPIDAIIFDALSQEHTVCIPSYKSPT